MAKKVKHGNRAHALLSASGASRWLSCPPSARLEEKVKTPDKSSIYADEGTLAHELSELELRLSLGLIKQKDYDLQILRFYDNALYSEDMAENVDQYVKICLSMYEEALKQTPDAKILIEEKVDLTEIIKEGFGTCDVNIVADRTLKVVDLKFGKGIKVSAENNSQLKLYGVGALLKYGLLYAIEYVELNIIQPRLDSFSTWTIKARDLLEWAYEVVKPTAELAYEGKGEFKPGEHCHFCKVAPVCKSLAAHNLELAKHEFKDANLLTDAELLDIFAKTPMLTNWANKVGEFILNEALNGKKWDGYKLVEGRSNRKINDEAKLAEAMKKEGYQEEDLFTTKLKSITDLTKLAGKPTFERIAGPFFIKPPGKPTLVPEDDKRPAFGIESAKSDFK